MGTNRIRELLKLTPFLLSDGGISQHAKNSWLIYFRNKDEVLIKEFQRQLKKCCGKKGYLHKRSDGGFMVKLTSIKLGEDLFNFSKSYRTKNCNVHPICNKKGRVPCKICTKPETPAEIPKEIFENKELAKYFLRIFFSCDGGVSITATKTKYPFLIRKVFVSVKHKKIADGLLELLKRSGFSPKYYGDQIRLTTKEDITNFKKIGFLNGNKIGRDSKKFYRKTKNEILHLVIGSYKNPQKTIHELFS